MDATGPRTAMGKLSRERKRAEKKKERWLLTRKTWRYMADAGRKLVPEGINKAEDLPKIEAYFQEVCQKEPKFLLWRKQSYPGALGFRRRRNRKKGGSCRDKASSADEAEIETPPERPDRFELQPGPSGKFDLQRMKREFFFGKQDATSPPSESEINENLLIDTIKKILYQGKSLDHEELLEKLQRHLAAVERTKMEERRKAVQFEGDIAEISLLDTLSRYFSKTSNREKVVGDLLTDRKKLEKLYFELRQARGFMAGSRGSASGRKSWKGTYRRDDSVRDISRFSGLSKTGEGSSEYSGYSSQGDSSKVRLSRHYYWGRHLSDMAEEDSSTTESNTPTSPPPTVEIEPERTSSHGTQTDSLTAKSVSLLEEEIKKLKIAEAKENEEDNKSPPKEGVPRRSSLVDNDDVSPSVSDTIKRYLRMARKKSADGDKIDRFKRVNYDRNLRNIKAKGEITKISDDDGLDKGAQTDESWVEAFKNLKMDYEPEIVSGVSSRSSLTEETVSPTSPTSKSFLTSGQNFLSNLLHGLQDRTSVSTGGMQKSRSSTSVVQQGSRLVAKKIWKSRSKSQSRATPSATSTWTPQGDCLWSNVTGRSVRLEETQLTQLTDLERRVLQKVALAKLQALNLGVPLKIPPEHAEAVVQKPKRRAYLLKRKAQTTAFDPSRKDLKDKEGGGMVFGVPLSQCVENERGRLDVKSLSRASFSSLITPPQGGSCESLISPTLSMPGLDSLSCGSTQNLGEATGGSGVPNLVTSCLRHLETFGLHTLGIFRVSSSKKRVRQLREDFDCGKHVNLEDEQCPHDIATLLKEYFRDLPDPLLCKDLYQAYIHTQRIRNRRLQQEALQHLVQLLPVANRDTLWSLLNLLYMVSINSNDHKNVNGEWISGNKMDSSNLATMFAPNLLHPCTTRPAKEELSAERTEERADAINVIRTLIDNHKALFQISAELLDEVYVHMMDSHPEALDQLLRQRDTAPNQNEDTSDEAEKKTWVKEDIQERIVSTTVEKSRRERGRERRRRGDLSSDSGQNTPDEGTEGVITASLKIPVPGGAWNLDDIPYIEESGGRSESGVGSMSRGGSSTWESSDSEAHHPLRVTIHHTSLVQQVQPSYSSRTDSNWSRSSREKLTKSASSSAVIAGESTRTAEASRVAETVISRAAEKRSTAITCIGDRVMRSKTADFERMLNRGKASAAWDKEYKRKYAERQEEAPRPTKGLWKRRELISSQPKDKSSYY